MTVADSVLAQIPEFLKTRPTKEQLYDFLAQLDRAHPEERPRLIGVALLIELADHMKRYPPHVRAQIAAGAERLLQEIEPFGDHPEDYFTPLLNAGWIKGETLIDKESPPALADLLRLKAMLDRDQARQYQANDTPARALRGPEAKTAPDGDIGKVKAIQACLRILNDESAGLPGRGRFATIIKKVTAETGMTAKSVRNAATPHVREWETQNPGR